ncbi:MAG: hypothetical protein ABIJ16_12185 [Bacteroidota bacterium]
MMKKNYKILISVLLTAFTLLSSCDFYESSVPLSDSSKSTIDTSLTGRWVNAEKENSSGAEYFDITAFNEHEYLVKTPMLKDSRYESVYTFRMFNTLLNNKEYFNLVSVDLNEERNYTFYKYDRLKNGDLQVYYLSDDYLRDTVFTGSKELCKFIKANTDSVEAGFKVFGVLHKSKYSTK